MTAFQQKLTGGPFRSAANSLCVQQKCHSKLNYFERNSKSSGMWEDEQADGLWLIFIRNALNAVRPGPILLNAVVIRWGNLRSPTESVEHTILATAWRGWPKKKRNKRGSLLFWSYKISLSDTRSPPAPLGKPSTRVCNFMEILVTQFNSRSLSVVLTRL